MTATVKRTRTKSTIHAVRWEPRTFAAIQAATRRHNAAEHTTMSVSDYIRYIMGRHVAGVGETPGEPQQLAS